MKVNEHTIKALACRRQERDLKAKGYEQITCKFGVGDLWELDRGGRTRWRITDAIVGIDGKSVYVLAQPPS